MCIHIKSKDLSINIDGKLRTFLPFLCLRGKHLIESGDREA